MAMEPKEAPLLPTKSPNLPLSPMVPDRKFMDDLGNVLRLYFNQVDNYNTALTNGGPFSFIDFYKQAAFTDKEARLGWNNTDKTLEVGMDYGVIQQIGQETYARVGNTTGVTIPNGTVVGFAGATSDALLVAPYLADGSSPSLYILGVMTHDLPDSGQKGYCTTWGFVRDLDTSAFSEGDILYANPSTAGGLTNVKPTAPNNVIPLAACITSNATTGVIFVRPTITQMQYYGEFAATTNQTVAVINTAYAVTFNTTNISNGVALGTPASRVVVPVSGLYRGILNIQFSSTSAAAKNIWCWFRKNGTDLPYSARITTSDVNNGYLTVAHDCTVSMQAGDYLEVMYAADSTNIFLNAAAATAFAPAAPAATLSFVQLQQ